MAQQHLPDVITGYVHKVSEVHSPTRGNPYFDFNLQLSPSKVVRGICYSPEKRAKLKETQEKKIPVKIDNVQASVACVVNTFLLSLDKPSVDHFTELELLHLLSSYPNLDFTVSETDKLISEITLQQ